MIGDHNHQIARGACQYPPVSAAFRNAYSERLLDISSYPSVATPSRHDVAIANPFSGPGSRPSGPGFRYSGAGSGSGPAPVPEPEDPNLIPDCRDLRPEDVFLINRASGPLACIAVSLVTVPPCQRVSSRKRTASLANVSTCPRAPSRLRRALVPVSPCPLVPSRKRVSPCAYEMSLHS